MAGLAEEAILRATKALRERDKDLARSVIEGDGAIDALELDIESRIIDLLALRQPMAVDLRFVTTGMKINAELERIADLAVNIAQRVIMISDQPLLKPFVDTPKLSDIPPRKWSGRL
jgi:phosphate transport system protein